MTWHVFMSVKRRFNYVARLLQVFLTTEKRFKAKDRPTWFDRRIRPHDHSKNQEHALKSWVSTCDEDNHKACLRSESVCESFTELSVEPFNRQIIELTLHMFIRFLDVLFLYLKTLSEKVRCFHKWCSASFSLRTVPKAILANKEEITQVIAKSSI